MGSLLRLLERLALALAGDQPPGDGWRFSSCRDGQEQRLPSGLRRPSRALESLEAVGTAPAGDAVVPVTLGCSSSLCGECRVVKISSESLRESRLSKSVEQCHIEVRLGVAGGIPSQAAVEASGLQLQLAGALVSALRGP